MAAPLKRVCRAVPTRLHCSQYGLSLRPNPTPETPQWRPHPISQSASRLHGRAYTTSPINQATAQSHESDDLFDDTSDDIPLPDEGDLSSTAHAELAQHREIREMTRLAAWEMPLLTSLSKPFTPPDYTKQPLRWRYTTYFGDSHPASRKVVVEFRVGAALSLDAQQQDKFRKLCGARYNPETNTVRMSCESFATQAQNKRYLSDVIRSLVAECQDPEADTFADVPLDTRHHKFKKVLEFPAEWRMTPERRKELDDKRQALLLEEGASDEKPSEIVSGIAAIEAAKQLKLAQVEEPVMVQARQPLAKGKMGKREMGQRR